jgi:hypothetical protein
MAEIEVGEYQTADRRNLFVDSEDNKIYRRVRDASAIEILTSILDQLTATGNIWTKTTLVIPPSTTQTIDVTLISTFSRIDYIVNFKNPSDVTKSMKIVVQNDAGNISDVVSERMGGALDVLLNVTDDSVDTFLEITNNELTALTITFLRAQT